MSPPEATPPRMARAVVEWLVPPGDAGEIVGDLDEEFARYAVSVRGVAGARRWYRRQVLLSAPRLLWRRISWGRDRGAGLDGLAADLRLARRVLARRPGFTTATVITLALALGVNTTVFSVVHAVLLRSLPFAEADRLVRPVPDQLFFLDSWESELLAERTSAFESFAAWGRTLFSFSEGGQAEEVRGARVAWNHFDVLGVEPLMGRTFVREDAASDDAIVLGHGLWLRAFGGDPDVVGRAIELYGRRVTVVGVLRPTHVPLEFDWEAWRTLPLEPAAYQNMGLAATARLRPGVGVDEASAELGRVFAAILQERGTPPTPDELAGMRVVPLSEWLSGDARQPLLVMMLATGFLLILACTNVSNLLLAQSGSRQREFAVRGALGGSRGRVARQLLVEVSLLCVLGGTVGLALAFGTMGWFRGQLPADLPRSAEIGVSSGVVWFTLACTLASALVSGLLPARRAARMGGSPTEGVGRVSSSRERTGVRSTLVAAEMAMALVLVVGAGLMARTLLSLRAVDPGFDGDGVVTLRPSPPASRYPPGPELEAYYAQLEAELSRVPTVRSVGGIQFLPMTPGGWWTSYLPEGRTLGRDENAPSTAMRVVRGAYFETMRIPILAGRGFRSGDGQQRAEAVALVNAAFADAAFPGESAVGRRVTVGDTPMLVVGVVGDVKQDDLRTGTHPEMYVPFASSPWQRMHLVLRHDGDPAAVTRTAASVVRAVDQGVAVLGPRDMSDIVRGTMGSARLVTVLLGLFGLVGLSLGAVGVYGVTAQSVAERRQEIGIRIALGADASRVATRTIVTGLRPVLVGVVVGLALAVFGGRVLDGLLFGVGSRDLGTFAVAPAVLLGAACVALTLPALRASRIDPVRCLRED